jgi:5'-AMP-activated protein kinase, catalytic alpha subunit
LNKGISVGYSSLRYEEAVFSLLSDLHEAKGSKFDREFTIRCLDANKHNQETTAYYLILSKLERDGHIEPKSLYRESQPSAQKKTPKKIDQSEQVTSSIFKSK